MRLIRARSGNASLKIVGSLYKLRSVDVGHPQVKQSEWVFGPLRQLEREKPQVPLPLSRLGSATLIRAGVDDIQVGPCDLPPGAAYRRQYLLVNPSVEPQVRAATEQLDVIDDRHAGLVSVLASARTVD